MKILRVSYRIPPMPGGLERHVAGLTAAQLRHGHQVTLAYRHGGHLPVGAQPLRLRPTALSRLVGLRSDVAAFAAEVAEALRLQPGYDLVHLHGDQVGAALLAPACRRAGLPLVLTVHGALARRHRWLARRVLPGVDGCVALGNRPARDLRAVGVPAHRIRTMCSGLDLAAVVAAGAGVGPEPGLVVSVGSLDLVKDHALTIAAIRRLQRAGRPVRLVVVGDGPLRAALAELAAAAPGVTLAGQLPAAEVWRTVASAEVFVLASRVLPGKAEGVPTAALEALALGTPALLSDAATLDPVVADDGGAYRTFPAGSVGGLAAALGHLLDDGAARAALAEGGRLATADLDWSAQAEAVERWYLAAGAKAGPRDVPTELRGRAACHGGFTRL